MISFLQGFLQKHHKWIFSLLLLVIIVSFVFTIGNSPGIGTGRRAKREKFFGYDLHSERERNALFRETQVSTVLNGTFIFFEAQLVQLALQRAIELQQTQKLHIPEPTEEQLREKMRQMPKFFAKESQDFDAASYEKTIQELLQNPQITPATIQKVLSDDWRIEFVRGAMSRQGYAFPFQARDTLNRAETQYSFDVLSLADEGKDEDRVISEEELRAYVQRHSERYSDPESYHLACLEFDPERYRAQIPAATKESLKKFYSEHKEEFQSMQEGSDEMKQAIGEAYEKTQARSMASQKASDFAYQLYEKELRPDSEVFDALITAFELRREDLPLFIPGRPREDERFSSDELSALVATLDEERPFSDPIETRDGSIAILVLKESLPPRPSEFGSIRERALEELLQEYHRGEFQAHCREISTALYRMHGEEVGKSFEAQVRELGLEQKSYSQLKSPELQAQVSSSVRQALETLTEGKVSAELLQDKRCEWVWLRSKRIDAAAIGEEQVQKALEFLEQKMAQCLESADFMDALDHFAKQPSQKK
ncbi:MAG: hypothetical protein LBT57_02750 [Puniceicoccales bacterium]|jgi:peptidyl-prolyl cis-trans isomerase D|nr:hypothetical protein [Puniceicoccales bacterium]